METPDARTHGADSAVDDEMVGFGINWVTPAQREAAIEAIRPIVGASESKPYIVDAVLKAFGLRYAGVAELPGSDEIPADMPNSPPGDIRLEYTLQNFNALVAANTAMQTEISGHASILAERDSEIGHLREVIDDSLKPAIEALRNNNGNLETALSRAQKDRDEHRDEADHQRLVAAALQRKLDRMTGYMDRVLDDEARISTPATRPVPVEPPPVGPNLSDIAMPARHGERSEFSGYADITGRMDSTFAPTARRRY